MTARRFGILALTALLLAPTVANAEEPGVTQPYLSSFVTNGARIATAPLRMDRADWWHNALVLGAVGAAYLIDEDIRDSVQHSRTRTLDRVSVRARVFGSNSVVVPALGITYLAGSAIGSPRVKETSLLGFETWGLTAVIVEGLKLTTHRHRPDEGLGKDQFDGPGGAKTADALPSGHAANAFAIASIIASEYADRPGIGMVAYSLATLTAWSRVNDDLHWTSDVLLGGAIGYGVGKLVFASDPFLRRYGLALAPAPFEKGSGIGLAARF